MNQKSYFNVDRLKDEIYANRINRLLLKIDKIKTRTIKKSDCVIYDLFFDNEDSNLRVEYFEDKFVMKFILDGELIIDVNTNNEDDQKTKELIKSIFISISYKIIKEITV